LIGKDVGYMDKVIDVEIIKDLIAKEQIAHLNTIGVIKLRDQFALFVDDLENPQGYIIQKDDWNIIYYEGEDARESVLEMAVEKPRKFSGVHKRFYDEIKKRRDIDFYEVCYLYYLEAADFNYEEPE